MSKLHIPGPAGYTLTACGRQLNNHRSDKAQDAVGADIAPTIQAYITALHDGKACRHCGRASGLVAPIVRARSEQDSNDE